MDANSQLLRQAFDAAVAAAAPDRWVPRNLKGWQMPRPLRVLALGKSATRMARAFSVAWKGKWSGLAVAPHGECEPVEGFRMLEAAHPVPDQSSLAAGEAALAFATGIGADEALLVLLSGGASSLACAPIPGVSLEAKAAVTRRMLASGADIAAINTVRRALSRIKGGGLLHVVGDAPVTTLAQSDVPGDSPQDIGSGPAVESLTGPDEAVAIVRAHAPDLAPSLEGPMRAYADARQPVTCSWSGIIGFGIDGAAQCAWGELHRAGFAVDHRGAISGDAGTVARGQAITVQSGKGPRAIVSGGELTVAIADDATGRGGRNQHFLLSLAVELAGRRDVWALAADTDGIDGRSDAAGAWIDPGLLATLDVAEARAALAAFDAHGFFERHGRLLRTGPTGVNVGDLRILLVDPEACV